MPVNLAVGEQAVRSFCAAFASPPSIVFIPSLSLTPRLLSLDALIADINHDILVARNSLSRPAYLAFEGDEFFHRPSRLELPKEGKDPAAVREKPTEKEGEGKL